MLTLYHKMNINYDKLYKNHELLLAKSKKFYAKLNSDELDLLNEYKLAPMLNAYLYNAPHLYTFSMDGLIHLFYKYKLDREFSFKKMDMQIIGNVKVIQERYHKESYNNILKFDTIFNKGISAPGKFSIYRFQPFEIPEGKMKFEGFTSFSLLPIPYFCQGPECTLYHTVLDPKYKFIYLETNFNDKDMPKEIKDIAQFRYEYELLFPRGIEFTITSKKRIKTENPNYNQDKKHKYVYVNLINIKFKDVNPDPVKVIEPTHITINY